MRTALVAFLLLALAPPAHADEPLAPPPPSAPAEPAPPVVQATPPAPPAPPAPALPAGVTPIADPRPVTFILSGGNRVVARRVGEDPEFVWIEASGRLARIRKADIATMDFQGGVGPAAAPAPPAISGPPPNLSLYNIPPPAPRGRGMVIWGGILVGVGYTAAVAASASDSTGHDGSSLLLAIPIVGPFFFAATDAAGDEPLVWVLDGLMQAGGVALLYFGIRRMSEPAPRRRPFLSMSVSPHGAFAQATWPL